MTKGVEDRNVTTNLDALLAAFYVHLDDHVLPSREQPVKRGPKRLLTDAELVCVAVAQVLLRHDSERHWMRAAPTRIGHLFPRLPGQSEYNRHLRELAPALGLERHAARRPHHGGVVGAYLSEDLRAQRRDLAQLVVRCPQSIDH